MLEIFADKEALAHAAASLFAAQARKAVALRGRFVVLLAGGETPRRLYELLARQPYFSNVPWKDVHFFWGDERCVPWDDPRSNYRLACRTLLDHLPLSTAQIHPIRCDGTPQHAADAYGVTLVEFFGREAPRFDLVLLGLGDDGHTASLLPGSSALEETLRWTAVAKRAEEYFSRITLTAPILNQARLVLFLVSGAGKAPMLKNMLQGHGAQVPHSVSYPAQLIRPDSGDLRWYVDSDAATQLAG